MARVQDYLQSENVTWQEYHHSPASTAITRAKILSSKHSVDGREVAKVILLRAGRRQWALAVLPAIARLRMETLQHSIGHGTRLASEVEIKHRYPWCSLGCLPALGHLLNIPQYMDPEICSRDFIVFAAGEPTTSVRLSLPDYLQHIEPGLIVSVLR